MDTRQINETYAQIAADLIKTEDALKYIAESGVTIVYLSSEHEKKQDGKVVFGQCEKIKEKYKWAIPADFTITLFEPNVHDLTDEQIRTVLFHELLHIGIKPDGDDRFFCVPHDIEDFRLIVDRYGLDWAKPKDVFDLDVSDIKDI